MHKLRKQHICRKAELHTVLQPPPVIQTHLVVGGAASIVSSLCVEASDVRCKLTAFLKQLKGRLMVKPTWSSLDIPPLIKTQSWNSFVESRMIGERMQMNESETEMPTG